MLLFYCFSFAGDFATKMEFRYNATSSSFAMVQIQNEVVLETAPCFRCTRVASLSWAQLQIEGNSAFWPLVVTGAPYYISDYEGGHFSAIIGRLRCILFSFVVCFKFLVMVWNHSMCCLCLMSYILSTYRYEQDGI